VSKKSPAEAGLSSQSEDQKKGNVRRRGVCSVQAQTDLLRLRSEPFDIDPIAVPWPLPAGYPVSSGGILSAAVRPRRSPVSAD
jgi:hypothetical protein